MCYSLRNNPKQCTIAPCENTQDRRMPCLSIRAGVCNALWMSCSEGFSGNSAEGSSQTVARGENSPPGVLQGDLVDNRKHCWLH